MYSFDIKFEGSCTIHAESFEEAIKKFWQFINDEKPLPSNLYEIFEIDKIEKLS